MTDFYLGVAKAEVEASLLVLNILVWGSVICLLAAILYTVRRKRS